VETCDKLLVLDLDETLVHATTIPKRHPHDFIVGPYVIYRRPGVERFLEFCLERFGSVCIWTSSTLPYAIPVLEHLLEVERLSFVWGRERCTYVVDPETRDGEWLKDLRKLRKRGWDRRKVIFVDDTPAKIQRSYGNLVRVRAFTGSPEDDELDALSTYLDELGRVPDVRPVEKRGWRHRLAPPG